MTRLAICGGPYSNPYALRAFVEAARARGADRLFCLGDFEPSWVRERLGSGHLAPLGDGVSIHDFAFNGSHVVD